MNKFESTTETEEKTEALETHEAPRNIEKDVEIFCEQKLEQSEHEIADFESEGKVETFDDEDRKELQELNIEAHAAQDELLHVINRENSPKMPPPLPAEYTQEYSGKMPPPLPKMPPPLPESYVKLHEQKKPEFEKIDSELFRFSMGEENFKKYIEDQKNLPPDAIVHLYHGLNSGGYESALEILNSPSRGIEQRSGPTVSLVPVGQFWKGVGFRYALRRDQIEFPGENNPDAVVKMCDGEDMIDSGYITTQSGSLPADQFETEVMRSQFADSNPDAESKLVKKLYEFSIKRGAENRAE